jgi:hypothetical protein
MSAAQLPLVGWRTKAKPKAEQLRELLADGRWHGQQALERAAGMRYGARLFDLHNNADLSGGFPVHYEKRVDGSDDARVRYRQTDKEHCDICTQEARTRPSEVIKRQAQRIEELERELATVRLAAGFQ